MESRRRMMTYREAQTYFMEKADMQDELEAVEVDKGNSREEGGFFQKLFSCFQPRPKLQDELSEERDYVFATAKVKYNSQIAEHEVLVKTIYKRLMKTEQCRQIGSHWQDIGFQATDPKTDIRGAGMFGVLQVLYMIDNYPSTMDAILKHSQHQKYEFPLTITMFELSTIVLQQLRLGKLYTWCNMEKDVWSVVNKAFAAIFFRFIHLYIVDSHDISNIAEVNLDIRKHIAKSKIPQGLDEFRFESLAISDDSEEVADREIDRQALQIIKSSIKGAEKKRIQKLQE